MRYIALAVLALFSATAFAQPAPSMRRRGSIEKVERIDRHQGTQRRTMTLVLADTLTVNEVLPADPAAIRSDKFVGTAALPGSRRDAGRARAQSRDSKPTALRITADRNGFTPPM